MIHAIENTTRSIFHEMKHALQYFTGKSQQQQQEQQVHINTCKDLERQLHLSNGLLMLDPSTHCQVWAQVMRLCIVDNDDDVEEEAQQQQGHQQEECCFFKVVKPTGSGGDDTFIKVYWRTGKQRWSSLKLVMRLPGALTRHLNVSGVRLQLNRREGLLCVKVPTINTIDSGSGTIISTLCERLPACSIVCSKSQQYNVTKASAAPHIDDAELRALLIASNAESGEMEKRFVRVIDQLRHCRPDECMVYRLKQRSDSTYTLKIIGGEAAVKTSVKVGLPTDLILREPRLLKCLRVQRTWQGHVLVRFIRPQPHKCLVIDENHDDAVQGEEHTIIFGKRQLVRHNQTDDHTLPPFSLLQELLPLLRPGQTLQHHEYEHSSIVEQMERAVRECNHVVGAHIGKPCWVNIVRLCHGIHATTTTEDNIKPRMSFTVMKKQGMKEESILRVSIHLDAANKITVRVPMTVSMKESNKNNSTFKCAPTRVTVCLTREGVLLVRVPLMESTTTTTNNNNNNNTMTTSHIEPLLTPGKNTWLLQTDEAQLRSDMPTARWEMMREEMREVQQSIMRLLSGENMRPLYRARCRITPHFTHTDMILGNNGSNNTRRHMLKLDIHVPLKMMLMKTEMTMNYNADDDENTLRAEDILVQAREQLVAIEIAKRVEKMSVVMPKQVSVRDMRVKLDRCQGRLRLTFPVEWRCQRETGDVHVVDQFIHIDNM